MWISENLDIMQRIVECSVENKIENTKLNAKFLNGDESDTFPGGFMDSKQNSIRIYTDSSLNTWFLVCLLIPFLWPGLLFMFFYKFMQNMMANNESYY